MKRNDPDSREREHPEEASNATTNLCFMLTLIIPVKIKVMKAITVHQASQTPKKEKVPTPNPPNPAARTQGKGGRLRGAPSEV